MNANHFEAKKHAYRQTQDGVVISFVVHPSDVSEAMAMAPLGTRFMVAFAEIGDDEKLKGGDANTETDTKRPGQRIRGADEVSRRDIAQPQDEHVANPGARSKTAFKDKSLPEQAGIRCADPEFWNFMIRVYGGPIDSADDAAASVRKYCRVKSRADLSTDREAANRWRNLEVGFQGHLTDKAYASQRTR